MGALPLLALDSDRHHLGTKGSDVAVRIRLSDGSAFVVDDDFHETREKVLTALNAAFEGSAAEGGESLIDVRNGNGKMRSINPLQIAYLEETDEGELTAAEEQILEAARDPQPQPK